MPLKITRRRLFGSTAAAALAGAPRRARAFLIGHGGGASLTSPDTIQALFSNGQTFITRPDLAQGAVGQTYRYTLYRSNTGPITQANLASATVVNSHIANNSGQLFGGDYTTSSGSQFTAANRINSALPMTTLPGQTSPLALWTCLAVYTCQATENAWYCILENTTGETVQPGVNSMTSPVAETPFAVAQPYLQIGGGNRTPPAPSNNPTNTGKPIEIHLLASSATGGTPAGCTVGDYWAASLDAIDGTTCKGWADGEQLTIDVMTMSKGLAGEYQQVSPRETIWRPDWGSVFSPDGQDTNYAGRGMFQPACDPTNANFRYYMIGYNKLLWLLDQLLTSGRVFHDRYLPDPNRIWIQGDCMGGRGGILFGVRNAAKICLVSAPSGCFDASSGTSTTTWSAEVINLSGQTYGVGSNPTPMGTNPAAILLGDNVTQWGGSGGFVNAVDIITATHTDLPYILSYNGRHDNIYQWPTNVAGVQALRANGHGVAYIWDNLGHGVGNSFPTLQASYPNLYQFPLNQSYPAMVNASFDDDIGTGTLDPNGEYDGDKQGAVGMDWQWSGQQLSGAPTDTPTAWSCVIQNTWMDNSPTLVPTTSLTGNVPASGGFTVGVVDTTNFSTSPLNTIEIDEEQMTLASFTATSITVTSRGLNGTLTQAHSTGAPVIQAVKPTGPNRGPFATATADVWIRRRQSFKPAVGATVNWTATYSGGGSDSGSVLVDANGQIKIPGVTFKAGQTTTLSLSL